jgi:pectin methylesterase-like acyl-CoA thioesterase
VVGKLLLTLAGIAMLWSVAIPKALTVCASGCEFTSIQTAVDAAASGDTIQVKSGIYRENLVIAKEVTIVGSTQTVLKAADPNLPVISVKTTGEPPTRVKLFKLQITGSTSSSGLLLEGRVELVVEGCTIASNDIGVTVHKSASLTLRRSQVCKNTNNGLITWGAVTLEGSTISENQYSGVNVQRGYAALHNCDVSSNDKGLELFGPAQILVDGCKVIDNRQTGINASSAVVELKNSLIGGNGLDGLSVQTAQLAINHCELVGNSGAAVLVWGDVIATLDHCWLSSNYIGIEINSPETTHITGSMNIIEYNLMNFKGFIPRNEFLKKTTQEHLTVEEAEVGPKLKYTEPWQLIYQLKPGGLLRLHSGKYRTPLIIAKDLRVVGDGPNLTVFEGGDIGMLIGGDALVEISAVGITGCDSNGLLLEGSSRVLLDNCWLAHNHSTGVNLLDQAEVSIKRCEILGSSEGIWAADSSKLQVDESQIIGNEYALLATDSAQAVVTKSRVLGNTFGFTALDSAQILANNNKITDNKFGGIYVPSEDAKVTGSGNIMHGNGVDLVGFVAPELRSPLTPETDRLELHVPDDCRTIQEAIDAVPPGGIIIVASGTHEGGVTVWKPVTIKGAGTDESSLGAVLDGGPVISVPANVSNIHLEGLSITGSKGTAIVIYGQIKLTNLKIHETAGNGVIIGSSAKVVLDNCELSRNSGSGAIIEGIATFKHCTVFGNRGDGLSARELAQVVIKDSVIESNFGNGIRVEGRAHLEVYNTKIIANHRWGISAHLKKCGSFSDYFVGKVIISNGNLIQGNWAGQVCLPQLCVPMCQ